MNWLIFFGPIIYPLLFLQLITPLLFQAGGAADELLPWRSTQLSERESWTWQRPRAR